MSASVMPIRQPPGCEWLVDEPEFDADKHLALEKPERAWRLTEFGYQPEEVALLPFDLGMTSTFRMLSDEGLAVVRNSVERLTRYARSSGRISRFVRGNVYRSRFIRDLSNCPVITDFVSKIAGAGVAPHTMPLYQAHINLKPTEDIDVDKWHTDTVALDYVLLLTDPASYEGGAFQFYPCHRQRAIQSLKHPHPDDPQPIEVEFEKAGYAILQQGNMVVHRARQVTKGDERTTLVQSYMPTSPHYSDVSKLSDCRPVDPHDILFAEWARHKAWLSIRKLEGLIKHLPFTDDRDHICAQLRSAIRDVQTAVIEISDETEARLVHYDGDVLTDPKV